MDGEREDVTTAVDTPEPGELGGRRAARPYHLVVPRGSGWWRPLVGTVVLLVLWLVGAVAVVLVGGIAESLLGPSNRRGAPFSGQILDSAVGDVLIAVSILAVGAAALMTQHRGLGTVSSVRGRLRLRWLAVCVAVTAVLLILDFLVALLIALATHSGLGDDGAPGWPGPGLFAVAVLVVLLLVPFQAAGEEYVARGWLLQMLGTWTGRSWPGVLVGGAVWTGLHAPSTWGAVADLGTTSLVYGWLVWRTGGLEAAVAQHAVNNIALELLLAAEGDLSASTGTANAGNADWTASVHDAVVLLVYAAIVVRLHRRMGLERLTPPDSVAGVP